MDSSNHFLIFNFLFLFLRRYSGFRQKYEESLPDTWPIIVQNRPEMFSFYPQPTNLSIVFKNALNTEPKLPANETLPPLIKTSPASADNRNNAHENVHTNANPILKQIVRKNDFIELPPIELPWDEPVWRIEITAASSTGDVWGHLYSYSEDWVSNTPHIQRRENAQQMT